MPRGVVIAFQIVTKNDLRAWVVRVALIAQKLRNVLDILVASMQLIFAARVVDPDEE